MNVTNRCGSSKSDKNIGAGGWQVDNLFEAADSGDVLAHSRITGNFSLGKLVVEMFQVFKL